jgi:hypothetical protein
MMRRVVTMAVVVALAASLGRADDKTPAKDPAKAPLPRADSVEWDVATFEDSAAVKTVKREVKNGQVVWVLENRRDLGPEIVFGYQAEFFNEDGVKLMSVGIRWDPFPGNLRQGERNRLILELPQAEKCKNIRKVVIKG